MTDVLALCPVATRTYAALALGGLGLGDLLIVLL